ncbi:MAG: hypothetical protein LBR30_00765 [Clostridioides sp.]|nr:hypothetical protein [Clostridioides sp.]
MNIKLKGFCIVLVRTLVICIMIVATTISLYIVDQNAKQTLGEETKPFVFNIDEIQNIKHWFNEITNIYQ